MRRLWRAEADVLGPGDAAGRPLLSLLLDHGMRAWMARELGHPQLAKTNAERESSPVADEGADQQLSPDRALAASLLAATALAVLHREIRA